jgi:hypothetical protein
MGARASIDQRIDLPRTLLDLMSSGTAPAAIALRAFSTRRSDRQSAARRSPSLRVHCS